VTGGTQNSTLSMKHLNIKVFGNVQGVFYRHSSLKLARELGLKGKVWNEKDGTVMIQAEGDEGALMTFTNWCKKGPTGAKVDSVEITECKPQHFSTFYMSDLG
jgi:acylphosphatase